MDISQFKLIKNKQRPDWCYKYQLTTDDERFVIFTIDGGDTFHAYIEERSWYKPDTFFTKKEDLFKTIQECVDFFNNDSVPK